MYDSSRTFCSWSSLQQQCTYIEPEETNYVAMVIITVVTTMVAMPVNQVIAVLFANYILPPVMTRQLMVEKHLERERRRQEILEDKRKQPSFLSSLWRGKSFKLNAVYLNGDKTAPGDDQGDYGAAELPDGKLDKEELSPEERAAAAAMRARGTLAAAWGAVVECFERSLAVVAAIACVCIISRKSKGKKGGFRRQPNLAFTRKIMDLQVANQMAAVDPQVLKYKKQKMYGRMIDNETMKVLHRAQDQHRELSTFLARVREARLAIRQKLSEAEKKPDAGQKALRRLQAQVDYLDKRIAPLEAFKRDFEQKWFFDERGQPRSIGLLDQLSGTNFYMMLRRRIKEEVEMASKLEQMLLELPEDLREIRLLEYQRLDFMSPSERKIYVRNQIELIREEPPPPIEPWKKALGWVFLVFINLVMAFYVFLFGVRQGAKTANAWLGSFVGSLVQDPLLNVPLVIAFWNVFMPMHVKHKLHVTLDGASKTPFIFKTFIPPGPASRSAPQDPYSRSRDEADRLILPLVPESRSVTPSGRRAGSSTRS
jgi:hypothetical protein